MVWAPMVRISRPVRPACWAEASSRTPTCTPGVGDVVVEVAADGDPAVGGWGEPDHDAHRGRLAGAVGAEEPGHPTGLADEADVVDGGEGAVLPSESFDVDHGSSLPERRRSRASAKCHGRGQTKVGARPRPVAACAATPVGLACWVPEDCERADPEAYQPRLSVVGPRVAGRRHARHQRRRVAAGRRRAVRDAVRRSTSSLGGRGVRPGLLPASLAAPDRRGRQPAHGRLGDRQRSRRPGQRSRWPPAGAGGRWRSSGRSASRARSSSSCTQPGSSDDPFWLNLSVNVIATAAIFGWGMYIGSRRELMWTLRHRAERAEAEQELRVGAGAGQRAGPDRPRDARRPRPPDLPGLHARRRAGLPRGPHPREMRDQRRP